MKVRLKSTLLIALALVACIGTCFAGDDFDIVTIRITATSYDDTKPPVIAPVKYNKLCPLVITSDDMGACELNRNWAYFNGYPAFDSKNAGHIPTGADFLESPYNPSALAIQNQTLKRNSHQPLIYSDGTGGVRRFTATSAIWPHHINGGNYTLLTNQDPKVMIRTRWSFAQHDVDNAYTTDAETIAGRFKALSELWEGITGVGLKVMVEPTGDHRYIDAGKQSDEICWNIFQNGQLPDYPEMTNVLISDWNSGTDWTSFSSKPAETTRRLFFQGSEQAWKDAINNADGTKILLGGTHGIGDDILLFVKELSVGGSSAKADQFWVAGADEVWEYYHLYNNASIQNVSYADGTLTFEVKVPQYKKHQFRELTVNIPGISNGSGISFSDNVVIGSGQQNTGQYTINIGMESNIYTHIEELIAYYRAHFHNEYVKLDAQYLINLLKPGTTRENYQNQLDAEPNYSYVVKSSNNNVIVSGISDTATPVSYGFPKYELIGTDLYEANANGAFPYYVNTFTPAGKNQEISINYTKALENVVFFSEGENLENAGYNPVDKSKVNNSNNGEYLVYQNGSSGAGGIITSSPITTLQPGKYKLVVRLGDSWNSIAAGRTAVFTFKLGDKTVYTCQTRMTGIEEFTKEDIVVKEEQSFSVEATGCGVSRWLDYLYIQKTGDYDATNPTITLTATSTDIDVTNEVGSVTLTATTTPKNQEATVTQTVIKDATGNVLANSNGNTCTYVFTPNQLGNTIFTAEGTDSDSKTGLSDELTICVTSDFTLNAQSNIGDNLASVTLEDRSADEGYTFLYPRYILKGTDLYETSGTGEQMQYGERITFTMASNNVARTINYNKVKPNIVFYAEAEDNALTGTNKNRQTIEYENITQNKGERYALTLGSMGYAVSFSSLNITEQPAGSYKLYAGIGLTNGTGATFTVKSGDDIVGTLQATSPINLYELSTDEFTIDSNKSITMTCSNGNTSNWLDYVYIQKLDAVPVTVGTAGMASFASPYTLDFSKANDIKAYRGVDETDKVMLYQLTGLIPAGEGLYLKGLQGEVTNEAIPLATTLPDNIGTNDLVGVIEATMVAAGNYVLSVKKDGSSPAFRRLTTGTEVPAGRSYLKPNASQAPQLYIDWDNEGETTGIRTINTDDIETSTIYNLKGMPADGNKPGLVIRNGKIYFNKQK